MVCLHNKLSFTYSEVWVTVVLESAPQMSIVFWLPPLVALPILAKCVKIIPCFVQVCASVEQRKFLDNPLQFFGWVLSSFSILKKLAFCSMN